MSPKPLKTRSLETPSCCEGKRVVFTMHSTEGGRNGDMGKGHPGPDPELLL